MGGIRIGTRLSQVRSQRCLGVCVWAFLREGGDGLPPAVPQRVAGIRGDRGCLGSALGTRTDPHPYPRPCVRRPRWALGERRSPLPVGPLRVSTVGGGAAYA